MDRPFLKAQEPSPNHKSEEPESELHSGEASLVSALTLIWRVLSGRRHAISEADIPDIAQEAALRLWKWRGKHRKKAGRMTMAEWDSFAARTAHNEINRFFSKRVRENEVAVDEASATRRDPAGNADAEMFSLVAHIWQETCKLSVYQRRALLFGSPDLMIYFIRFGIGETEIVASLDLSNEEWRDIAVRLPLSDTEIAEIARPPGKSGDSKASARAIKKARFDARKKLGRLRK